MSNLDIKFSQVEQCKQDIKQALINKGIDMTGVAFTNYASKIEDSLERKPQRLYLYKEGIINTDVVGGFDLYKHSSESLTKNADHMVLTVPNGGVASIIGTNALKNILPNYTYLYLEYEINYYGSTNVIGFVESKNYYTSNIANRRVNSVNETDTKNARVKRIVRLSSMTFSNQYIDMCISNANNVGKINFKVYNIWLEKEE